MGAQASAPSHVALIPDGNRRWAKQNGVPVSDGIDAGADTLSARISDALELGVRELTVYSFSTENWTRAIVEVDDLISVLARRIAFETPRLRRAGVSIRFIGRRDGLGAELAEEMDRATRSTSGVDRMTLFIAINYGGRAEILDAAKRFGGGDEAAFRQHLYAPALHDPDLIIRTSGERRLSNYLLWQAAYSELVFRDELWPDFTRADFEAALGEFGARRRRFGGR
jgi:undecaprenyl diphosphate synthase